MAVKVKVTKDTVTTYLDTLTERYDATEKYHLKSLAHVLTGKGNGSITSKEKGTIGLLLSKWNPNLYLSGQEEDRWLFEQSKGKSSVTVNYTGMTYERRYDDDEFQVWWEFSKEIREGFSIYEVMYQMDPEERTLARDYAYYQETTYDPIADPRWVRRPHAIRRGTEAGAGLIFEKSEEYLHNLINLK